MNAVVNADSRATESAVVALNALGDDAARQVLTSFCGSTRWVSEMNALRPFASQGELLSAASAVWQRLQERDYLEAFSHHPKIGADLSELERKFGKTAQLSASEQSGVEGASRRTLLALRDGNLEYERRHGFIFIVCASGKSAEEMLELLRQRLDNPTPVELRNAACEQAKITELRIRRWTP